MRRCPSGAYDATDAVVSRDSYDEQDRSLMDAEALKSLLAIVESLVKNFDLSRIVQGQCRGGEADTVLGKIGSRFALIHSYSTGYTTGYRYQRSNR
jgi:hypothetical protein